MVLNVPTRVKVKPCSSSIAYKDDRRHKLTGANAPEVYRMIDLAAFTEKRLYAYYNSYRSCRQLLVRPEQAVKRLISVFPRMWKIGGIGSFKTQVLRTLLQGTNARMTKW